MTDTSKDAIIASLSRDLAAAAERELALQDDVRRASADAARIEALEAENARLREVLAPLRDTEWREIEPNSRADLPEEWQAYIEEMELFANYWIKTAHAAIKGGDNDRS